MNKQNITRYLRRAFLALAIVGAVFILPTAKADRAALNANGTSTDCEHVISQQVVGGNTIITLSITACFHGTFDGTWVGTERDVIHPDNSVTLQGSGVFSGAVNGRTGTTVFSYLANISQHATVTHWVVNEGTDELAGLHGQGTQQEISENGPGCPATGFDCVTCPPETGGCDDSFTLGYTGQIGFAR